MCRQRAFGHGFLCIASLLALSACRSAAPRPAFSSYGCMSAVVRERVPPGLPDKRTHCLASGLIVRHCSRMEAYAAGAGKELRDLFGRGDAGWADWSADRIGIRCARDALDDAGVAQCCEREFSQPH